MHKRMQHNRTVTCLSMETEEAKPSESSDGGQPQQDRFDESRAALARFEGDLFVYSGTITYGQEQHFSHLLHSDSERPSRVTVWITTPGGDPDTAYQIARLLQKKYEHVAVYVNGWCKSSGTLICLGANELIMDDLGQLGPLDIQILNREEFGERLSGLNPIEALKSISLQSLDLLKQQFLNVRFGGGLSTKQALEVATNLTGQLMSPITAQLDIMKYGEFTRSMRIAVEYGNRLVQGCGGGNLKPDAINLLTTGYPSHGFVIDRDEAESALFNQVSAPCAELRTISRDLQTVVDSYFSGPNNSALLIDLRQALGVPCKKAQPDSDEKAAVNAPPVTPEPKQVSKRKAKTASHEGDRADPQEAKRENEQSNETGPNGS